MIGGSFFESNELLRTVVSIGGSQSTVYLVGGSVRDLLLNRQIHDFDFAVDGNACRLARKVANKLGVPFYVLDEEYDAGRVLLTLQDGTSSYADFTRMRAKDISGDLLWRDYTINAIAINLLDPDDLIDPLGGSKDLIERTLRVCSDQSLSDDPVRIMRGVRLAVQLELKIESDTLRLMRKSASNLSISPPERIRSELFRMLAVPRAATCLRLLDQLGVIPTLMPELLALKHVPQTAPHIYDVWDHTLSAINAFDKLWSFLVGEYQSEAGDLLIGLAVRLLGRYRNQLAEHYKESGSSERPPVSLLRFIVLYHDIAKPQTASADENGRIRFLQHDQLGADIAANRATELALSRAEVEHIRTAVRQHMRIHWLANADSPPSRRAIYRYFRDTGSIGIDIGLLSLADTLATYGPTIPIERWQDEVEIVRTIFEAWFEKQEEIVDPPRLITGDDLLQELLLSPGPIIGDILEAVRERQAIGELSDKDAALKFAQQWLNQRNTN